MSQSPPARLIGLENAWEYLKSQEENLEVDVELPVPKKYGWFSIFCSLLDSSASLKLSPELQREKDVLISLSRRSFNHEDSTHIQMLLTLFNSLTGGLHCPSVIGTHWDIIGFQGTDPATDFRGVGMLGLLQPMSLSLSKSSASFMLEVISLSHSPSQGFPFMVLSLNVTQIVLVSLRDGYIDRLMKDRGIVLQLVNTCYGAVLYHIYDHWKKENLTLVDSGLLLKKAETNFRKDPLSIIQQYENYIESKSSAVLEREPTAGSVRLEEIEFHICPGEDNRPIPVIQHTVIN